VPATPPPPTRTTALARLAPPDRTGRLALSISCGLLTALLGIVAAVCAGLSLLAPLILHPGWALVSAVLAVGLGLPYIATILWVDRNEQEPWWLLLTAWAWGAVMATGLSMLVNTTFGAVALGVVGDAALAGQLTASLSAPVIEEITKGAALAVLYLFFRHHFDNVLDGLVYGAMVGMGFAMVENFVYYMSPFMSTSPTATQDWVQLVLLRGVITAFGTHWCFTALTGAGFGLFRVLRHGALRWLVLPAALGVSMFAHFAWNTFTGFFIVVPESLLLTYAVSIPLAVVVLQLPFVAILGITTLLTLRHEGVLIRRYLGEERKGIVLPGEIERLVPARRRLFHALALLGRGRLGDWWRRRRRDRLLITLAFERWHMDKEEEAGHADEAGLHARRVVEIRRRLRASPPPS
jgi:protease PrsW